MNRASKKKPDASEPKSLDYGFPVVGIGASAGGVEAFKLFFQSMPSDSGMAFILIQHLDPTRESLMVDLLTKYTSMNVVQVRDAMPVEPNTVFMIPPNAYLAIVDGKLELSDPGDQRGARMSIDYFFRSLASDRKERAICVVLSGAGADGALGLRAVKEEGGAVFVQDSEDAKYDEMPNNAIATGLVDWILPVEDIPKAILKYVNHAYALEDLTESAENDQKADGIQSILSVLRTRLDHDFRCYKAGALTRRIHRRMGIRQIAEYGAYAELLRSDQAEIGALYRDLLIGVTAFFRDGMAWEELERTVLPNLCVGRDSNDPIRIWVPGCGSGEEVYTIAMLVTEALEKVGCRSELQIFASDVDVAALEIARTGVYSESIAADIPPERLSRFFIREEKQYRVEKRLRESVVFARQNIVADPPFSRLDLISCRNLLIYLDASIQNTIISLFHFSLKKGGYLILGPSEGVGQETGLFENLSKEWRIFRRIGPVRGKRLEFPVMPRRPEGRTLNRVGGEFGRRTSSIKDLAHEILLREFAPASVIANRNLEAMYFVGPVENYFQVSSGNATQNLVDLARDGVGVKLRTVWQRAIRENETISAEGSLRYNGRTIAYRLNVRPLCSPRSAEGLFLVSFVEIPIRSREGATPRDEKRFEESEALQLEYELAATREDLQSTIEELDAANAELKASNEEVMSMNEELQSSNEELETSKEELQSLNEELNTVNTQLQEKLAELESSNNDMANLLDSSDIATLFLDLELKVRRFTPASTRLFKLIPSDIGRSIEDIQCRLKDDFLLAEARRVLRTLRSVELEVGSDDDGWFICRILPFRASDDRVDGVVATFVDITRRHQAEIAAAQSKEFRTKLLASTLNGVYVYDTELGLNSFVNEQYTKVTGYTLADIVTLGKKGFFSLFAPDDRERVEAHLANVLGAADDEVVEIEYRFKVADGRWIWCLSRDCVFSRNEDGSVKQFIGCFLDITKRKELEHSLRKSEERYRLIADSMPALLSYVDSKGNYGFVNRRYEEWVPFTVEEIMREGLSLILDQKSRESVEPYRLRALKGERVSFESEIRLATGVDRQIATEFIPDIDAEGNVLGFYSMVQDVSHLRATERELRMVNEQLERLIAERTSELSKTVDRLQAEAVERSKAEQAVTQSEARLRRIFDSAVMGVFTVNASGVICEANGALLRMLGYSRKDLEIGQITWSRLRPSDLSLRKEDPFRKVFVSGAGPAVELDLLHKRGRRVPVSLSLATLNGAESDEMAVGFVVDETRRYELQKLLVEFDDRSQQEFARELHDGVCQLLVGAKFQSNLLIKKLRSLEVEGLGGARKVDETLEQALNATENLLRGMHPVSDHELGLSAALRELAHQISRTYDTRCVFTSRKDIPVPDSRKRIHLYRIANQAADNAVQHSGANKISISFSRKGSQLVLRIVDDGCGFDADGSNRQPARKGFGLGLESMRHRARLIGARLNISSEIGKGSEVECIVPRGIE